jgi:hypothetical protein
VVSVNPLTIGERHYASRFLFLTTVIFSTLLHHLSSFPFHVVFSRHPAPLFISISITRLTSSNAGPNLVVQHVDPDAMGPKPEVIMHKNGKAMAPQRSQ